MQEKGSLKKQKRKYLGLPAIYIVCYQWMTYIYIILLYNIIWNATSSWTPPPLAFIY